MERTVVIDLGYTKYAVPAEVIALLPQFRKVGHVYDDGYVYYYEDDADSIDISLMRPSVILPGKPTANTPVVVAAPSIVFVDGVAKAPPEDGSEGVKAARDLVAESGDYPTMSFVPRVA